MDASIARKLWAASEPAHAYIYFVPEAAAAYSAIGMEPISQYFASRAAGMGAVNGATVAATFYNFSPKLTNRAMRDVWSVTSPAEVIAARYDAATAAGTRLLTGYEATVEAAIPLLKNGCEALSGAGRPLFAGHATVEPPDDPIGQLWHYLTLIREFRGDGHVLALVEHDVDPLAALITSQGSTGVPLTFYRRTRGWTEEEWNAATERLIASGTITETGGLTPTGADTRQQVESLTNRLAMAPWTHLGETATQQLAGLVGDLSAVVTSAGGPTAG